MRSNGRGLVVAIAAIVVIGGLVFYFWNRESGEESSDVVRLDLARAFPFAEKWSETTQVDFGTEEAREHYQGDDGLELILDSLTVDEQTYTYQIARDVTRLQLFFPEAKPRIATLRLSPLSGASTPRQTAKLRLNGQPIGELELEVRRDIRQFQERTFDLPADAQTPGLNRFELEWGFTKKISEVMPSQSVDLMAAAWLLDLKIRPEGVPQSWPPKTLGEQHEKSGRIFQEPGATVRYYTEVPESATLAFAPRVEGTVAAEFRVEIRPETGEGSVERFRVEPGSSETRRIDLAPWAGQIVRLALSVEALDDGGRGSLGASWGSPSILAPASSEAPTRSRQPDSLAGHPVVMILCDAMRADALSATGAPEGLTPHLDALAKESVVFEEAFSQASYTVSSIPSIFSGLYPQCHGIVAGADTLGENAFKLKDETKTIASGFRGRGYRTGAVVSNLNAGSRYGNGIGFDDYLELGLDPLRDEFWDDEHGTYPSRRITEKAVEWLDDLPEDQRSFFLYVHYFEPHAPYWPDASFEEGVVTEYHGAWAGSPEVRDLHAMNHAQLQPDSPFGPEDLEHIKELYQATTRSVDASVGLLLDDLKRRGVYDDAMIIVISDHGEEFTEHGLMGHGEQTYDEGIHVPLMIKMPKGSSVEAGRRGGQAELVDLLPTLYALFDLGDPPPSAFGDDLSVRLAGEPDGKRFTYAIALLEKSLSIRGDGWKYIEWPWRSDDKAKGRHLRRLYHLASDPGAQVDVLDEHSIRAGFLRQQMHLFFDLQRKLRSGEVSGEGLSDQAREDLIRTGYVGQDAKKQK